MADVVGTLRVLLEADASTFDRAMKEASVDVKELGRALQKDLEPRQRAVNAAVRDFLGGNEIRKAQEWALALDKIGDISKLTEKDQQKVNRAMQEALSHYRALGIEAPKNLVAIEKATSGAGASMQSMWSGLKGVAGLIGVTFTAGAVVNFAKSVVDTASDIDDMSKKLGVSAEAAQRFKFAAEQTGASITDVERAISVMNRTLGEGSKGTVKALSDAGLKFTEIRAMKPEQAFRAIADAVGRIPDPMRRAAIAQELFGRGALELLPMMSEGIGKLSDDVTVMSNDTVKRLSDAQDAWEGLFNAITIHSAETASAFMRDAESAMSGWELVLRDLMAVGGNLSQLPAQMRQTRANMQARGPRSSENFGKDIALTRDLAQATAELTDEQKKALAAADAYRKKIQAIADVLTGKKLAQEVSDVAAALKMAGGESSVTTYELGNLAEKLDKIQQQGGRLTPELQAIRDKFMYFRDMVKATRIELELLNGTALAQVLGGRPDRSQTFQNMPLIPMGAGPSAKMKGKPLDDWRDDMGDIADSFERLANIAGDSMSSIARSIGVGIASADMLRDSLNSIASGFKTGDWGSVAAGMVSAAAAAVQMGESLMAATDSIDRGKNIAKGAASGASMGMQIAGPWGALVGAGVGALVGAFRNQDAMRAYDEIARDTGIQISEELAKTIQDRGNALGGGQGNRWLAEVLSLGDVVREAGGITEKNFEGVADQFWQAQVFLGEGTASVEQFGEMADQVFPQLAAHAVRMGGVWQGTFRDIVEEIRRSGVEVEGFQELLDSQLGIAAGGLNKTVAGAKPSDQGEFDRLSRLALATFNAFIANGQNATQAIDAIGPSIDALKSSVKDFGFAGNEAFNQLSRWRELTEANRPLLEQLGGLNEMMMALANVGALDAQTFADIQAQGLDTFQSLRDAGFSQQEALAQIAPMLETIITLHAERGLAVDEETQALIDQARQQGLLQDEQLDTNEILMEGIGALIEVLGGELPQKWKDMARDAADAASDIEDSFNDIDINIPINFDQPRIEIDVPGAASGAFVKKRAGGHLVRVGEGQHDEWIIPEPDLAALAREWQSGPSLGSLSSSGIASSIGASALPTGSGQTVILQVDERVLGEVVLPSQLDASRRYGVTRA